MTGEGSFPCCAHLGAHRISAKPTSMLPYRHGADSRLDGLRYSYETFCVKLLGKPIVLFRVDGFVGPTESSEVNNHEVTASRNGLHSSGAWSTSMMGPVMGRLFGRYGA